VSYPVPMTDRELQSLRRQLGTIPRGRGRRIPAALRKRITEWATARRGRGTWWSELARQVGVPAQTLMRWAAARNERSLLLRPVEVLESAPDRSVTIVSPSGLRVEGLTITDVITILRGLA
jgi:transposase-like protein